jgi:hypothetical protein
MRNALSIVLRNRCLATSYSCRGKPPTTIGAEELNFRVRYGNGCDLFAIVTRLISHDKTNYIKSVKYFKRFSKVFNFIRSKLDKKYVIVHKSGSIKPF